MQICYLDESGTPEIPGNTSHYILAGLAIPIWKWKYCDERICEMKRKFGLEGEELHTAWIARAYPEQRKIPNFEQLKFAERRIAVEQWRCAELLRLQKGRNHGQYKQTRKNYAKTAPYVHLTFDERHKLLEDAAREIASWSFARLFADCVNKISFTPTKSASTPDEEALEQVVSRLEHCLAAISRGQPHPTYALLIHDNNETVAKKHTRMLQRFHRDGTLWADIHHIVETPLFVSSELTGMVQLADLCAYALRRYLENNESALFDAIFTRADKRDGKVVGVRHFSPRGCLCKICAARNR